MKATFAELVYKLMMRFNVDQKSLDNLMTEVFQKVEGMKILMSPAAKQEFAKASFTILAKEFIRRTSILANANPRVYHHIYEWNHVGDPAHKLYRITRARVSGGVLSINSSFLQSNVPVPIDPILRRPGSNGKIVTKSSIFRNKAEMMESGKPSKPFSAKNAKALAYVSNGKIVFVKRPQTRIIRNPGGRATVGAYTRQFYRWFGNPATINAAISRSGLYEAIEKNVARSLNVNKAGATASLSAMKKVTDAYSMGVVAL